MEFTSQFHGVFIAERIISYIHYISITVFRDIPIVFLYRRYYFDLPPTHFISSTNRSAIMAMNSLFVGFPFAPLTV